MDVFIAIVVFMIIGARLYFVAFSWDQFRNDLAGIFATRSGGLAFYGGVLGGLFGIWLVCRIKKIRFSRMTDFLVVYVPLGQAIGRWGNFFNQEAFGIPTDLPWKLYIDPYYRPPQLAAAEYFHPTFLYESLWSLGVFLVLWFGLRKPLQKRPGALTLWYLALYSIGRFWIEPLRIDSLMLGPLRVAQLVSALLFVGSVLALALMLRRRTE
jgi:phosphatidylglycerol:prolipoprotein diacylglycerol transferase